MLVFSIHIIVAFCYQVFPLDATKLYIDVYKHDNIIHELDMVKAIFQAAFQYVYTWFLDGTITQPLNV